MPPIPSVIGFLVVGLAVIVMLPLPFSNLPPAIALLCLAFGLLERDGLMIVIGLIAAAIALTVGAIVAYIALEGVALFWRQHFG